eukprot:1692014-Lingulodinium_polyedra.AAC.1
MPALHVAGRKALVHLPEAWLHDLAIARRVKPKGSVADKLASIIRAILGQQCPEALLEIMSQ